MILQRGAKFITELLYLHWQTLLLFFTIHGRDQNKSYLLAYLLFI